MTTANTTAAYEKYRLYTAKEVSEMLNGAITPRTIKDWANRGTISHQGGIVNGMRFPLRFTLAQVEEILATFERPAKKTVTVHATPKAPTAEQVLDAHEQPDPFRTTSRSRKRHVGASA